MVELVGTATVLAGLPQGPTSQDEVRNSGEDRKADYQSEHVGANDLLALRRVEDCVSPRTDRSSGSLVIVFIAGSSLHLLVGQTIMAMKPTTSVAYIATVTTTAFNFNLCAAAMTVEGRVAIT